MTFPNGVINDVPDAHGGVSYSVITALMMFNGFITLSTSCTQSII